MIKVLLLEDDMDLSSAIQQELIRNGYSVDCLNDGETGMLYALNKDYGYDLAIVDRMLPVIDGLTIIKAMRRKDIQIPVIIITGSGKALPYPGTLGKSACPDTPPCENTGNPGTFLWGSSPGCFHPPRHLQRP